MGMEAGDEHAVIRLEDVAVRYVVQRERITSFKEYIIRAVQGRVTHDEFWALHGVSLHVDEGETFGLVGRNGAGKSTLLKVISRVLRPTRGRIRVRGHVAPLLELGAGFHTELTGRENVFLNGALLGYTRAEISALFDEIVDFAGVWEFIDAPLRTYSTGMLGRLGFAVATAVRPDILLVDEVLSVGDLEFQQKCEARIDAFRQQGTTTIITTHSRETLHKFCERAVWLDRGLVRAIGEADVVASAYADSFAP